MDPTNLDTFAKALLDAMAAHNWPIVASLVVIAVTYLLRRFGGEKVPFLRTDRGGVVLVLATSIAGAVANALLAGQPLTLSLLAQALGTAITAAGGFSVVKKLLSGDAEKVMADAKAAGEAAAASDKPASVLELVNGKDGKQ